MRKYVSEVSITRCQPMKSVKLWMFLKDVWAIDHTWIVIHIHYYFLFLQITQYFLFDFLWILVMKYDHFLLGSLHTWEQTREKWVVLENWHSSVNETAHNFSLHECIASSPIYQLLKCILLMIVSRVLRFTELISDISHLRFFLLGYRPTLLMLQYIHPLVINLHPISMCCSATSRR